MGILKEKIMKKISKEAYKIGYRFRNNNVYGCYEC